MKPSHPRPTLDVLHLSLGTSMGARRGDAELMRAFEALGLRAWQVKGDFRRVERLRSYTPPWTDFAEAAAMRWMTDRALARCTPRSIMFSSTTAALLQPLGRMRTPSAVWMDAPAAANRPGLRNGTQRALERRYMGSTRLLLAKGVRSRKLVETLAPPGSRVLQLHVPIEPSPLAERAEPYAVSYVGSPWTKGLDLLARAWSAVRPGVRLLLTGIDEPDGVRYLTDQGLAVPPGWVWKGRLSGAEHRRLVAAAAWYVSAARAEAFGQAQLEALADGVPLITLPAAGTYESIVLAQRLDARLVGSEISAHSLETALRAGLGLSGGERERYATRARAMLKGYSRRAFVEKVDQDVLPALLG